jgi:hypothetical protein
MVFTRQNQIEALNHVLKEVLGKSEDSALTKALHQNGLKDIASFITMDSNTIESLKYNKSSQHKDIPINKGDQGICKSFINFVIHRDKTGEPIGTNWLSITQEEFDVFRSSVAAMPVASPPPSSSSHTSIQAPRTPIYSPAEQFIRTIKRDPSLFPTLKDERYNDVWHRSFLTQARAQDVSEVLDPNYSPSTQSEKDLFAAKQKFVYAILEQKVLTDKGKELVRDHESDSDAQAVYKKLQEHHLTSTKAMIDSSTILSYITSARLGSGEWKGTTESFIRHWKNQVRLYERQIDKKDHFSDALKRTMLENAVHPIAELRQVKRNADLEKAKTGTALSYDKYVSLLTSAATAYDEKYKPGRSKRLVYAHEMQDDDGEYNDANEYEDDIYDIDLPVSLIQANAHDRRRPPLVKKPPSNPPRVRMARQKWS